MVVSVSVNHYNIIQIHNIVIHDKQYYSKNIIHIQSLLELIN